MQWFNHPFHSHLPRSLLIGDVPANAKKLAIAQASQRELLDRCVDALGFSQVVGRIEVYLRDRNMPHGSASYCLDQGADSWVRIRAAKLDLPIPPGAAAAAAPAGATAPVMTMGAAFSGCTLEVTTQVPLATVGEDMYVCMYVWVMMDTGTASSPLIIGSLTRQPISTHRTAAASTASFSP